MASNPVHVISTLYVLVAWGDSGYYVVGAYGDAVDALRASSSNYAECKVARLPLGTFPDTHTAWDAAIQEFERSAE